MTVRSALEQSFNVPAVRAAKMLGAKPTYLRALGADDVTAICLLAAPEGIAAIEAAFGLEAQVNLVVAGLDERLNEVGYIVPGLGDAGDRLYGVV